MILDSRKRGEMEDLDDLTPPSFEMVDLRSIIRNMPEEQLNLYKEAFAAQDKNGNGTIRVKSLIKVLRTLGQNPTEEKIEGIELELAAKGKIEFIDFIDFLRIMYHVTDGEAFSMDQVLKEAFNMFDTDGGGFITNEEFRTKMLNSGIQIESDEVDEIIHEVDLNKDGVINLQEFAVMLKHSC